MFFVNWDGILRVFISALFAYFTLIIWLRISGKRTLSKWNAFDFVATIALGSVLATVIVSKDVVLLEGVLALILLIGFQYIITWLSTSFSWVENLVKAEPTLLYGNDSFLFEEMKKQRVPKAEILAAVRSSNIGTMKKVEAVVLETDGSFSVIEKSKDDDSNSALEDVKGVQEN